MWIGWETMNRTHILDDLKLPPHNIQAEQMICGALLNKPDAYDQIDSLSAQDFYSAQHRHIYHAIRSMLEAGRAVDALLVADELESHGKLNDVGGMSYLGDLAAGSSAVNLKSYAEIVKSRALLRRLQALASDLGEQAYAPGAVAGELADSIESQLTTIRHGKDESEPIPFHAALDAAMLARSQPDSGLHTGFYDLDRMLKPLRGGELIVIAGRPSMGKSALAANIGEHIAASKAVGLWSLEMSRASIAERILGWHERRDDLAASKLAMLQLHIDTPHTLTIGGLRMRAKRLRRKSGLSIIIVDYLGLMRGEGENRTQQIGSVSRGLKGLALEFDVPVIAVAQLNRANESRTDKRPMLSDLRESGDIEQDADIVLMVYRDEYYSDCSAAKGTAEVLVRKHRNGATGMVRLGFVSEHARFESYSGPPIYEEQPRAARHTGKASAGIVDFKRRSGGDNA